MRKAKVAIDSVSWQKGFNDGKAGRPHRKGNADGYSYASGYIEGKKKKESDDV
ncbi:MAG: hypothetical protein AB7C96_12320 [Hydrogenovibrio sp.]